MEKEKAAHLTEQPSNQRRTSSPGRTGLACPAPAFPLTMPLIGRPCRTHLSSPWSPPPSAFFPSRAERPAGKDLREQSRSRHAPTSCAYTDDLHLNDPRHTFAMPVDPGNVRVAPPC